MSTLIIRHIEASNSAPISSCHSMMVNHRAGDAFASVVASLSRALVRSVEAVAYQASSQILSRTFLKEDNKS